MLAWILINKYSKYFNFQILITALKLELKKQKLISWYFAYHFKLQHAEY